jgi:hypothetical protein
MSAWSSNDLNSSGRSSGSAVSGSKADSKTLPGLVDDDVARQQKLEKQVWGGCKFNVISEHREHVIVQLVYMNQGKLRSVVLNLSLSMMKLKK